MTQWFVTVSLLSSTFRVLLTERKRKEGRGWRNEFIEIEKWRLTQKSNRSVTCIYILTVKTLSMHGKTLTTHNLHWGQLYNKDTALCVRNRNNMFSSAGLKSFSIARHCRNYWRTQNAALRLTFRWNEIPSFFVMNSFFK